MAPLKGSKSENQADQLQIQHFIHQHLLQKLFMTSEFNCDGCNTGGFGVRFRCSGCDFDLHEQCAAASHRISAAHLHPHHNLILVNRPGNSYVCHVCKGVTNGLSYTCENPTCVFNVHTLCIQIPASTTAALGGHNHNHNHNINNNSNYQPVLINHQQPMMVNHQQMQLSGYNNNQTQMINHHQQPPQRPPMTGFAGGYNQQPMMVNHQVHHHQQQNKTTAFGGYVGMNSNQNQMINHHQQLQQGLNGQPMMVVNHHQQQQQLMTNNHQQLQGGGYNNIVNNNQTVMINQPQQQSSGYTKVGKIAANILSTSIIGIPLFNSRN